MNALKATYHAEQFGKVGEGIVQFIAHRGCDLAVLGTRAKWNLRDFLWGSTAQRVVYDAECSVLTVKPIGFKQS
jgi:nucleotide-binding universal stress UspA family protein